MRMFFGAIGVVLLALLDACLAALVVLAAGALATLAWYVVVQGAPPLGPILAAWRSDAPISLGLFLPPALTVVIALLAGLMRCIGACWAALLGGAFLRWIPRLQMLVAGR